MPIILPILPIPSGPAAVTFWSSNTFLSLRPCSDLSSWSTKTFLSHRPCQDPVKQRLSTYCMPCPIPSLSGMICNLFPFPTGSRRDLGFVFPGWGSVLTCQVNVWKTTVPVKVVWHQCILVNKPDLSELQCNLACVTIWAMATILNF